ncbi:hypothetical protein Aduo_018439 [Ancylostoma duodenale]
MNDDDCAGCGCAGDYMTCRLAKVELATYSPPCPNSSYAIREKDTGKKIHGVADLIGSPAQLQSDNARLSSGATKMSPEAMRR